MTDYQSHRSCFVAQTTKGCEMFLEVRMALLARLAPTNSSCICAEDKEEHTVLACQGLLLLALH
jgi:hypothetical protein